MEIKPMKFMSFPVSRRKDGVISGTILTFKLRDKGDLTCQIKK